MGEVIFQPYKPNSLGEDFKRIRSQDRDSQKPSSKSAGVVKDIVYSVHILKPNF